MCPAQAFTSDKMVLVLLHNITLPWLYRRIANENIGFVWKKQLQDTVGIQNNTIDSHFQ